MHLEYYEKVKKLREFFFFRLDLVYSCKNTPISLHKEVKWSHPIYDYFSPFRTKEDFDLLYLYHNELV